MEMRWTPFQELVFFYLAIFLLVIGGSASSAQNMSEPNSLLVGGSSYADTMDTPAISSGTGEGTVDVVVQNWRGFATKDGESHSIRLNVETIRTLDPDEARRLLASNVSLEELKSKAKAGYGDAILRGSLRLNSDSYGLIDITLASSGNISTLGASVSSPRSRSGSEGALSVVGHTVVTISMVDDKEVAEGYLVINDSKYSGTYSLLLSECYGRGPRAGKLGRQQ